MNDDIDNLPANLTIKELREKLIGAYNEGFIDGKELGWIQDREESIQNYGGTDSEPD